MKQTMSDLSILQRVYLGFALLVAVMVASAALTFRGQSELNDALDQVTQQSMPLVIASSQTQISLLSANKWLTDVLTEQDPKLLPGEVAELQQAKAQVDKTLATLKQQVAAHPELPCDGRLARRPVQPGRRERRADQHHGARPGRPGQDSRRRGEQGREQPDLHGTRPGRFPGLHPRRGQPRRSQGARPVRSHQRARLT